MKILLINNFHYRKGGSESVYFNTASLLRRAGHDVVFFSFDDPRNEPCREQEYFVQKGGMLRSAVDYFYNRRAARSLERLIDKEQPDIAHVHLIWGGMSPSILRVLKRHGIPAVHTAHDYRIVCPAYAFRTPDGHICERCGGKHFYRCAVHACSKGSIVQSVIMTAEMYLRNAVFSPERVLDGIIFVSRFSQQKHFEYAPQLRDIETTVLYNVAPETTADFGNSGRREYFLYVGRLSGEKGLETAVNVFAAHRDLKLKIVGTGPLAEQLQRQAAECPNIVFEGYKSGDSLRALVADASFVIVPSQWYENNPMSIIEAYAQGVPVIGSDLGGIPEIVEEGRTGFLFEAGNTEAFGSVLRHAAALERHEYDAMCRNARNFARKHFNNENYTERLTAFYRKCITNTKK